MKFSRRIKKKTISGFLILTMQICNMPLGFALGLSYDPTLICDGDPRGCNDTNGINSTVIAPLQNDKIQTTQNVLNAVRGITEGDKRGTSGIIANMEYRYSMSKVVQAAAFVETGKSWGMIDSSAGSGAGVGLRIKSAMGLIRLDAAKSAHSPWQMIFGIGQAF